MCCSIQLLVYEIQKGNTTETTALLLQMKTAIFIWFQNGGSLKTSLKEDNFCWRFN